MQQMLMLLFSIFSFRGFSNPAEAKLLQIVPNVTYAFAGDPVTIHCKRSKNSSSPVDWKHRRFGTSSINIIYSQSLNDFAEGYSDFVVKYNSSMGNYDLEISNFVPAYIGTYFCVDFDGETGGELVLIDQSPSCSSNVSSEGVLGNNDCQLAPDYIGLNCSVSYRGNIAPKVTFRYNNSNAIVDRHISSLPFSNSTELYSLVLESSRSWNEVSVFCQVETGAKKPDFQKFGCSLPAIKILYGFNNTSLTTLQHGLANCAVDTNALSCRHRWRASKGNYMLDVSSNQLDPSQENVKLFNDYQCFVDCNLNGKVCQLSGQRFSLDQDSGLSAAGVFFLVVFILLLALIIILILIKFIFMERLKRQFPNNKILDRISEQKLPKFVRRQLNVRGKGARIQQSQIKILIEHLDVENGLIDCLYSKEVKPVNCSCPETDDCSCSKPVLTSKQYNLLSNDSNWKTYQNRNKHLLDILIPNIVRDLNDKYYYVFVQALEETKQEHIVNFIKGGRVDESQSIPCRSELEHLSRNHYHLLIPCRSELEHLSRNHYHLLHQLDLNNKDFVSKLLKEDCITDQHIERIKARTNRLEKNREFLSILRRRSRADFRTFGKCLKDFKISLKDDKKCGAQCDLIWDNKELSEDAGIAMEDSRLLDASQQKTH